MPLSIYISGNHKSALPFKSLGRPQVLYMSNNLIARWSEVDRLKECPALCDVLLQVPNNS